MITRSQASLFPQRSLVITPPPPGEPLQAAFPSYQPTPLQASLFKQRVQAKIGEERQRAEGREAALMAQKEEVLGLLASEP